MVVVLIVEVIVIEFINKIVNNSSIYYYIDNKN